MASVAVLIGGAIANAVAFTGGQALFHAVQGGSDAREERERHDKAMEKLNAATVEWNMKRQKTLDYLNGQLQKELQTKADFSDVDAALELYNSLGQTMHPSWGAKPQLSDFYTPGNGQLNSEYAFIFGSILVTGILAYKYL